MGTGRLIAQTILMHGHSCSYCVALFAEMHSAAMEAKAIAKNARMLSRAGNRADWRQTRERWESARRRWLEASRDFTNHIATHGYAQLSHRKTTRRGVST
jgi:hypothetical protein